MKFKFKRTFRAVEALSHTYCCQSSWLKSNKTPNLKILAIFNNHSSERLAIFSRSTSIHATQMTSTSNANLLIILLWITKNRELTKSLRNRFPISTFPYLNTIWRLNSYYLIPTVLQEHLTAERTTQNFRIAYEIRNLPKFCNSFCKLQFWSLPLPYTISFASKG